jgi:hypothetical protein
MTENTAGDPDPDDPDADPDMKQTAGTQQDQAEGAEDSDETG